MCISGIYCIVLILIYINSHMIKDFLGKSKRRDFFNFLVTQSLFLFIQTFEHICILYKKIANTQSKVDILEEQNSKLIAEIAELRKKNTKLKLIIEKNEKRNVRVKELEQKNIELETRLAILEQGKEEKSISIEDV